MTWLEVACEGRAKIPGYSVGKTGSGSRTDDPCHAHAPHDQVPFSRKPKMSQSSEIGCEEGRLDILKKANVTTKAGKERRRGQSAVRNETSEK